MFHSQNVFFFQAKSVFLLNRGFTVEIGHLLTVSDNLFERESRA